VSRFRRVKLGPWKNIKLMIAVPRDGDIWGALAPLKETSWESLITVVSGEDLSHALHGWTVPLMRNIGIDPEKRGARVAEFWCALRKGCAGADGHCHTGSGKLPSCYEPIGVPAVAAEVALAWQDGWYVLVVEGPEFSF